MKNYYTYIMASISRVLYVGVTNDLARRASQHGKGEGGAFTRKYHATKLVYYETFGLIDEAIARENEIKGWRRSKKVALIGAMNPKWHDLAGEGDAELR